MENLKGKSLKELQEYAEANNCKIVILASAGEVETSAELIKKMITKEEIILVALDELPKEDQDKLRGTFNTEIHQTSLNKPEPIIIKAPPPMEDLKYVADLVQKKPYYQKKKKGRNNNNSFF